MQRLTGALKNFVWQLYFRLPTVLSSRLYQIGRRIWITDGRDRYLGQAFESARELGLTGDYLEFGVYKGDSFITATKLAHRYGLTNMRFFAFDCFEGVPESEDWLQKGAYACSEALFRRIVTKAGVDMDSTVIVPGVFSETLNDTAKVRHRLSKAAIVNVDCDLYASTTEVLKFIEDLIDENTIIIFDDWYIYGRDKVFSVGEGKAFAEWPLKKHCKEFFDFPGRSKAFLFSRNPTAAPTLRNAEPTKAILG